MKTTLILRQLIISWNNFQLKLLRNNFIIIFLIEKSKKKGEKKWKKKKKKFPSHETLIKSLSLYSRKQCSKLFPHDLQKISHSFLVPTSSFLLLMLAPLPHTPPFPPTFNDAHTEQSKAERVSEKSYFFIFFEKRRRRKKIQWKINFF